MNNNTNALNANDENEVKMTGAELKDLNRILVEFAEEKELNIYQAVVEIMKVDYRFGNGFNDKEIAIIMGLKREDVKKIADRTVTKMKSPSFGKNIKQYMTQEDVAAGSDF